MAHPNSYLVNEIFYSLQGEGMRVGTANVFIRFSKCNMRCTVEPGEKSPGGFDCDTEFESGTRMSIEEICLECCQEYGRDGTTWEGQRWIICTGGEPALQLDREFCDYFHERGWKIAVETNGSMLLPTRHSTQEEDHDCDLDCFLPDWITVSPKVAEHAIKQRWAHEVKYVRDYWGAIPQTVVQAEHKLISPAFRGIFCEERTMRWCIDLVKKNPEWRLSPQLHKDWGVR